VDSKALASFLRRRREALSPTDFGLSGQRRRRAVGLRREEVAQLAGVSVDYYARLEQGRGQPSVQTLSGLARSLRLDADEREHLFRLAGLHVNQSMDVSTSVRPALLHALERLDDCAAFVCTDLDLILAQNRLSLLLMGDYRPRGNGIRDTVAWRYFTEPAPAALFPPEDYERHARNRVADLRAVWSRRRGDADVQQVVDGLLKRSEDFRRLWHQHEVSRRRDDQKTFVHPTLGRITVDCEFLATADQDHRLVIFSAPPTSDSYRKLQTLIELDNQEQPSESELAASSN
jgi:transcriptional regulator with XRE-family HTH domain